MGREGEVEAGAALEGFGAGGGVLERCVGWSAALATLGALGDLPLAGIDLPAGHVGFYGLGVEGVDDELQVIGRADGGEDADALVGGGRFELPADGVAWEDAVALEGDAAEALALEIAGVGAAAVGDAVDPEATFGVDVLAVGLELEVAAVDGFEVFGVAGDLPGELTTLFAAGGG